MSWITAKLAVSKLAYLVGFSPSFALASVLGLLGGLLVALRRRRLVTPLTMAAAYAIPFTIIVPYFYRYRLPIEPVLAVLAGVVVACPLHCDLPGASGAASHKGSGNIDRTTSHEQFRSW
jgi:hypothetical protein